MGLTMGSAPLASRGRAPSNFAIDGPAHQLHLEPYPRRVRAVVAGRVVLDTMEGQLLMETRMLPVLYAPLEDFDRDALVRTSTSTHCPFKGDATYWSVHGVEDAAWGYEEPLEASSWLAGLAALDRNKIDHFIVEEERVFGPHLRDPYTRVDVHESSREVVVRVAGVEVARTRRPKLLFETNLPVRAYVPAADVAPGVLTESPTRTQCPYKGEAVHWHVRAGGKLVEDASWSYETPLPEALGVKGHHAFAGEEVEVDIAPR